MSLNVCQPEETSLSSIEQVLKGIEFATDSWLLLEDLPNMSQAILSAAAAQLQAVFLRTSSLLGTTGGVGSSAGERAAAASYSAIGPVVLVSTHQSVGVRTELPPSLHEQLRPVCFSSPEQLHVMQVLLAAHSISEYASTARKLDTLLSVLEHHPLLKSAHLQWGLPIALKMVAAVIQAHVKSRSTATGEALMIAAVQCILPRLTADEYKIVDLLVSDIIGPMRVLECPPHESIYPVKPLHHNVDLMFGPMGLKPNAAMKAVVIRVLESFWTDTLLFISGASRSGKSTALQMMAPLLVWNDAPKTDPLALARSYLVPQAAGCVAQHSCEAFDESTGRSTRVSVVRLDASTMSWHRFAGARQSKDGSCDVFSDQWRLLTQATQSTKFPVCKYQILLLDGHVPALWIENIIATTPALAISQTPEAKHKANSIDMVSKEASGGGEGAKVKLVLEGVALCHSNPCWASFAFVHVGSQCVGPEICIHRWLQTHPSLYQKQVAKQLIIFFPSVHKFVTSQVSLASQEVLDPTFAMESCLTLLDAILADCHARGHVALASEEGEVADTEVLERFMVWSLTWGLCGTAINNEGRKKFTAFLRNATSVVTPGTVEDELPIHDWAIDLDTGLWMRWGSVKEDEASHMGCGTLGGVSSWLLPTPEMLSFGLLVNLITGRARPHGLQRNADTDRELRRQELMQYHPSGVCLLGQPSCGKTLLMNSLLQGLEATGTCVVGRWNAHASSSATSLHQTLDSMLQPLSSGDLVPLPPQAGSQGVANERCGVLFVDDVHLAPLQESDNVWSFMRQLIRDQCVYPRAPVAGQRKFPWAPIRHMAYVVAMTSRHLPPRSATFGDSAGGGIMTGPRAPSSAEMGHDCTGGGRAEGAWESNADVGRHIRSRCLTAFVHFNMLPPTRNETLGILARGLRAHYVGTDCSLETQKLLDPIASATLQVVESLGSVLRPSRMACLYSEMDLRKVIKIARRMCLVRGDALRSRREAILLWLHEARNAVADSLMSNSDEILCKRHIAVVCAKVFSKDQDRKNKRVMAILEAGFLKDVKEIQYAVLPPDFANKVPVQGEQGESDLGLDDFERTPSALRAHKAWQEQQRSTETARKWDQNHQYVMVKKTEGTWLLDLRTQVLRVGDDLQAHSEEALVHILQIHRFLWTPTVNNVRVVQEGVDVERIDTSPVSEVSSRATESVKGKQALVLIEKQTGECSVSLRSACKLHSLDVLTLHELMTESERQIVSSSIPWDSDAMKCACVAVLATVSCRIAEICGVANSPLVLLCENSCVLPHLVLPLMQILVHGHVCEHLLAPMQAKVMAEIQEELKFDHDLEVGSSFGDLALRARVLLYRRVVNNFLLAISVQTDCLLHLDWDRVYDSSPASTCAETSSSDALLRIQALAIPLFRDSHVLSAPAGTKHSDAQQIRREIAAVAVADSFEACGLTRGAHKDVMWGTGDIVAYLASIPQIVMQTLDSEVEQEKVRTMSPRQKRRTKGGPTVDRPLSSGYEPRTFGVSNPGHDFAALGLGVVFVRHTIVHEKGLQSFEYSTHQSLDIQCIETLLTRTHEHTHIQCIEILLTCTHALTHHAHTCSHTHTHTHTCTHPEVA